MSSRQGDPGSAVTICNVCQRPVAEASLGYDGEMYHQECRSTLLQLE